MDVNNDDAGIADLSEAIKRLDKTQHIKPPTRVLEPTPSNSANESVFKVLDRTGDHAKLGSVLRNLQKSNITLLKPLERHESAKIKRSTGFEEVKAKLDRWNAIVAQNRSADHREFPLKDLDDRTKEPIDAFMSKFQVKSSLENNLDALQPASQEVEEKKFPLTMAEMIEHRKEMARLRAKQSYKEAKARRQSKIKSKKFHRIQRKERTKEQLKEFEILQKTNPEEALRKLELLEKTRAEERVTLRHKSTGQWAKNKLIRAKYDKETRQQLAEQLAISRDLSQKIKPEEDSDTEDEPANNISHETDPFNPWMRQVDENAESSDLVSGYKKYWEEQNKPIQNESGSEDDSKSDIDKEVIRPQIGTKNSKKINKKALKISQKKIMKKKLIVDSTTKWNVEPMNSTKTVDEENVDIMFDELLLRKREKAEKRIKTLLTAKKQTRNTKKRITKQEVQKDIELSKLMFKNKKMKPIIDEALDETAKNNSDGETIRNTVSIAQSKINDVKTKIDTIDPNKFVAPKPKHLFSALPNMDIGDEYIDDEVVTENKRMTIAEAFEDDDIVADFNKEKQDEIEKNKPKIDDSFLPGWGSWTGKNMNVSKRRRRRFIKAPKCIPRKDDNKPMLILNEEANKKIRSHLVSELPFPFTSVSDYESTIRAPLGNTFIPEIAHKKLTRPAVNTKSGVIIKPMDESQLLNPPKVIKKLKL